MGFGRFFKKTNKDVFTLDFKSFLPQSYTTLLSVNDAVQAIAILKETAGVDIDRRNGTSAGWFRHILSYAQKERENILKDPKDRAEAFKIYEAEVKRSSKETLDFLQQVFDHLEPLFQRHKVEIVTLAKKTFTQAKAMDKGIQVPTTPENAHSQAIYAQCRPYGLDQHHQAISDENRKAMMLLTAQLVKPIDDFMIFASHVNGIHWGMEHILRAVEKGEFDSQSSQIVLKRAI